jgi:hypothetical protein
MFNHRRSAATLTIANLAPRKLFFLIGLCAALAIAGTAQAQAIPANDEFALANPLTMNVKPVSGQPTTARKVEALLPGQTIKMEGGGEVRIVSEDGRIQITSKEGSVVLYDGMVKVESKPWLEDRPVLAREAQAGGETKLVPQFRINLGQADVEVVPGQEMRLASPLIISAVRGTKFSMSVQDDGSSFLNVVEGKVLSMARDGQVELLEAGKNIGLTAAKFTEFLRNLDIKIPVGGDWRGIDRQVLDQAVSKAFGDSLNFLNGAADKARAAKDEVSAKLAEIATQSLENNQSIYPRKDMAAKP